jgi:hypothetical protein
MKYFASTLVLVLCISTLGCGGGSSHSPLAPSPYPNVSGNWSLSGVSQSGLNWVAGGHLSNTDGSVTGTIHMLNSDCFDINEDILFSGTISKSGTMSLTSSAIAQQVITVTGTMTGLTLTGNYRISGGCSNGDKGTANGFSVPAFSNTYTGSFLSETGISVPVKMALTQTDVDAHGLYQLSGTATFKSQCFTTGTITDSVVVGSYMGVEISTDNKGKVLFFGQATDSTAKTISGSYSVTAGACSGDQGDGSVSHK